MNPRISFALALLATTVVLSALCPADDDGNFCTSKGYLAYELREGITPGVKGHLLRLVRFGPKHRIHLAGELVLPDFEVHTMTCNEDGIRIAGYGTVLTGDPPLTTCTVPIAEFQTRQSVTECTDDPTKKHDWRKEGPEPPNLAQWARSESFPLDSIDAEHKYQLVFSRSSKKVEENSWEVRYKTELVQISAGGNISQRFLVYQNRILAATCGD